MDNNDSANPNNYRSGKRHNAVQITLIYPVLILRNSTLTDKPPRKLIPRVGHISSSYTDSSNLIEHRPRIQIAPCHRGFQLKVKQFQSESN